MKEENILIRQCYGLRLVYIRLHFGHFGHFNIIRYC